MKENNKTVTKCILCSVKEAEYKYELCDGTKIPICENCGKILYNKPLEYSGMSEQLCSLLHEINKRDIKVLSKTKNERR